MFMIILFVIIITVWSVCVCLSLCARYSASLCADDSDSDDDYPDDNGFGGDDADDNGCGEAGAADADDGGGEGALQ